MIIENKYLITSLLLVLLSWPATGLQATDVLERSIRVRFEQTPLKTALAEIARQGGFEWSYNAGILDENRRVSLVAEGWTVRETLVYLLGDDYTFRQNGEYLILKKHRKPKQRLSGYISDRNTGQRMANVTVYDRKTLRSATTNQHGYYELPVTPRSEIVVSKLTYRDTVLQVNSQTPRLVKLDLRADSLPQKHAPSFSEQLDRISVRMEGFFVRSSQKVNAFNVRDSLHRHFQLSFLPGLGTNHRLSGSVINDWSLNVLAGYSRGNRMAELGGLGNIARENVSGFQGAGLFNIAGGDLQGVQAAGLFNNLGRNAKGLQLAGLYNYAGQLAHGAQFSGLVNIAANSRPAGLQAGGLFNAAPRGRIGAQLAGLGNHARHARFQAAGVLNTADSISGCQISGLINRGGFVRGAQIGLINIAGEIHGVQIGLINLSRRGGYIALELSANDVFLTNAAFKSGVPGLYTILTASVDPESSSKDRFWAYGVGLGTRAPLGNWAGLSFDLIHRHLNEGFYNDVWQEWEQLALCLDLRLGRRLSVAGGPSANLFVADPARSDAVSMRDRVVGRNLLNESNNADGWLSAWWGWTAALRLRF